MSNIKANCPGDDVCFKEAVCIDAGRVYDSCCEQHKTLCIYMKKGSRCTPFLLLS